MEKINKSANKTLTKLVSMMKDGYAKIGKDDDGFMPVVIEALGEVEVYGITCQLISVAHYHKQNGDLMADPEVVFWERRGEYFPISYKQDGLGICREDVLFEKGAVSSIRRRAQKDNKNFCNMWMKNIRYQQEVK